MSREKMAQAIVQGWDGAPEAHLVARIVEALAAVERETIGRAAKIANKWDSFVAKQILEAIQDPQLTEKDDNKRPDSGEVPDGAVQSARAHASLGKSGQGEPYKANSLSGGSPGSGASQTSKDYCPDCGGNLGHGSLCPRFEEEAELSETTQTVLNGCNHTARRALCDECFQKAMALACEAGRGLTVVHYTDKDIPRLLSEIARLKTAKAPAGVQDELRFRSALELIAKEPRIHDDRSSKIKTDLACAVLDNTSAQARPATSGGKND